MKTETPLPALFFHGTVHRGPGLPSSGPLTMHCLWSWVMTKASRDPEAPPPTLPSEAQSSSQSAPDGSCEEIPHELTLDALLEMDESKAKEMLRRWGASTEECSRLQQALTSLRKVTGLGGEHKEDSGWNSADAQRESSSGPSVDMLSPLGRVGASTQGPRSISVSALPASDSPVPGLSEGLSDTCIPLHASGRLTPRALHSFITPPTTPQLRRHTKLKPPRTPPPPSRKVFQLLPNFPALTRSKSHESQLGNRIDEVSPMR
ncbi:Kinase suppressor of Ras 1 [Lemmus lemmus]